MAIAHWPQHLDQFPRAWLVAKAVEILHYESGCVRRKGPMHVSCDRRRADHKWQSKKSRVGVWPVIQQLLPGKALNDRVSPVSHLWCEVWDV